MTEQEKDQDGVPVFERGQPVRVTAVFEGDPDDVFVVYTRPGDPRPIADNGFSRPGTQIQRIGVGVYRYVIDTTGFREGVGECHVWGTGEYANSFFPKYRIRPRPAKLLG